MAPASTPLVDIRSIANAQNEWAALLLGSRTRGLDAPTLQALFGPRDFLDAIAPLDCVVMIASPAVLTPPVLEVLPPNRVALAVRASALAQDGTARRLAELQMDGFRVLLDGPLPDGVPVPITLRTVARDCADGLPRPGALSPLFGPHLAHGVDTLVQRGACLEAGFAWISGDHVLERALDDGDDGTSRRRMLTLLALLARDADSPELEAQLKLDPTLSYQLLKLVNTAAFSSGTPITSFNQAISRLGRRQLQRWLQLLLYARQHPDDVPNPMLPLAACRGALLEALCKDEGGDRDDQDRAFMVGVFSLLDRLFGMPMADVVVELNLPDDVEAALLRRDGPLGARLRLAEAARPDAAGLAQAGIDGADWWQARLHAYHWAIQVARNV